jgi:hypothetical protein
MREDKSSRRLAETSLTGGRQVLDAGVFSARRLEDRITPARFVEGLSGLIRCTLRSHRPHAASPSAPRGRKLIEELVKAG